MTEVAVSPITEDEARDMRSRFPIFDHTVYLNSCSLGPLSRDAMGALVVYQAAWSRWGAPAWWKEWLGKLDDAKTRFARLIGAEPDEVTVSHSVSSALAAVAGSLDYSSRTSVVCADLDFPTIAYQWLSRAHQGVNVRFARSADHISVPKERFAELVDGQTALIATSHTFYTSGAIQPIRELADLAHSHGAVIAVDGYHAVGVHPVDVKALDVDFYIGGTLKWLLGGPGLTFLYVRPDLISRLRPTTSGWFAAQDQFAFDTTRFELAATADRFEFGTPAVATAYTGIAGMDIILEAGVERIYPRIQMLTERVVQGAQSAGWDVVSPLDARARGGIVMLRLDQPQQTVAALSERGFTVDYRPGLVRVSPHFYNTVDDVDSFMEELARVQRDVR